MVVKLIKNQIQLDQCHNRINRGDFLFWCADGIVTIIWKLTNSKSTSLPRPSVRIKQVPVVTQYQVKPQYAVQQPVQLKQPVYVESAESKELKSQVDAQSRQIELLRRQMLRMRLHLNSIGKCSMSLRDKSKN